VIPIVGATKVSQLDDNLASTALELDGDDIELLNEASAIKLGFPHDFYAMPMVRALVYGGLADRIKAEA
jgi:hypothetical protein